MKRVYLDRQPKIGDMVEVVKVYNRYGEVKVGYEYKVIRLGAGFVEVIGERMPLLEDKLLLFDGDYKIYEFREATPAKKPDEIQVRDFKLFGFKVWKKTIEIYK